MTVSGHDSGEDARTCMELMLWRLREDFKKELRHWLLMWRCLSSFTAESLQHQSLCVYQMTIWPLVIVVRDLITVCNSYT